MRDGLARTIGLGTILVLATACSSTSSTDEAKEKSLAQQLIKEADAAGVGSGLTISSAEALYGTDAAQLCDALDGGVSSAEALLLKGNPSGRREKLITTDAVTLGGLVVKTYCPDNEAEYKDLTSDIDATKPDN
jgi:hypothetical protein